MPWWVTLLMVLMIMSALIGGALIGGAILSGASLTTLANFVLGFSVVFVITTGLALSAAFDNYMFIVSALLAMGIMAVTIACLPLAASGKVVTILGASIDLGCVGAAVTGVSASIETITSVYLSYPYEQEDVMGDLEEKPSNV